MISSQNEYLESNLQPSVSSERIVFSPVIFEPRDSFTVNLLILGDNATVPSLVAVGKIAGAPPIRYATPESPNANKTLWQRLTEADAYWIHIVRFFVYFFCGMLTISLIALLIGALSSPFRTLNAWRMKKKRINAVRDYRRGENMDWEDRAISEVYIESGLAPLININEAIDSSKKRISLINELALINTDEHLNDIIKRATPIRVSKADEVISRGLLSFDGIQPQWTAGAESALKGLCAHLSLEIESIVKEIGGAYNVRFAQDKLRALERRALDTLGSKANN